MGDKTYDVDLICLGAGGACYPAAFRLAAAGKSVVMVDLKGVMSGNCLYEGCVPSKTMRELIVHMTRSKKFSQLGIAKHTVEMTLKSIMGHKESVQNNRYKQHEAELNKQSNIKLLSGRASFIDAHTIVVKSSDHSEQILTAANIIIDTGCDVVRPDIPGIDLCFTSHDLFQHHSTFGDVVPSNLVIVGGGYIGLETACIFAELGSNVTVLQKGDQLLKGAEPTR